MDIHKPKPWHGAREFLKEYLIIVIGVLTALGAEQAVEVLHWRHQVDAAKEELRAPIARDLVNTARRAAQEACVTRRLGELSGLLETAQATGRLPAIGPIGQPVSGPWTLQTWDALVAAQTVAHMPQQEMVAYTRAQRMTAYLSTLGDQEEDDWTILATMQGAGRRLSDPEAEQLRLALARASFADHRTAVNGVRLRDLIKEDGLAQPAAFAEPDKLIAAGVPKAAICQPLSAPRSQ
jgi:hypothetical protein